MRDPQILNYHLKISQKHILEMLTTTYRNL